MSFVEKGAFPGKKNHHFLSSIHGYSLNAYVHSYKVVGK